MKRILILVFGLAGLVVEAQEIEMATERRDEFKAQMSRTPWMNWAWSDSDSLFAYQDTIEGVIRLFMGDYTGEEAFERARRENKPLFISIGYFTCHWCHVMAHESFEDKETAKIMNQLFINIKVDREERPDLEDAKNQLIVSNAKMKAELKEIEDKILERLSASEGNPVDDVDLIKTLEASKVKSKEIKVMQW